MTPNLVLAVAGAVGVIAALGALLVPGALFESAVLTGGIAAFMPAAEPPLGTTARICLAAFAGGGVALLAWAGLTLLTGLPQLRVELAKRGPVVRRADAHPDAPPREPLRAGRDLGFEPAVEADELELELEPFDLDVLELPPEPVIAMGAPAPTAESPIESDFQPEAEPIALPIRADAPPPPPVQPLPADLDLPLAVFDPGALPDAPLEAPRPVAPLLRSQPRAPVYAQGERFETFDLSLAVSPPAEPATAPITGPETVATVHSLLDRLERGIARRALPADSEPMPETQGLESALESLRRMAVRG
ncbi:hypothetical protein [Sphingomonas tagetis]|uniref:hypothetical protein n=1 Tax=Sphingomonas tagetis TaxID=2949092 RepID=UPI0020B89B03|nr:hypothetical protein [Sphingomonas tagetis]